MQYKEMKFNIGNNPDISEAIQKRLFKLGYGWACGGKNVQFASKSYLYARDDGKITYGEDGALFNDDERKEFDIEWMKPEKRKTIKVGDKTYYEDELAEALSKINEVE